VKKIKNQFESPAHRLNKIDESITDEPRQTFLKVVIAVLLLGDAISLLALRLDAPQQSARMLGPVLLAMVALVAWLFLRQGRLQATNYTLAFGAWTVATVVAVFTGGVRAPVVSAYPAIILLATWMIGSRTALLITALTVAASISLASAESLGLLPTYFPSSALMFGGDQVVIYIVTILLATFQVRAYWKRVAQLRKSGESLTARTLELEASQAELTQAQTVAKVGSWAYELTTDQMHLSAETCRIFGLPEGTRGSYNSYLAQMHPDDRRAVATAWRAALKGAAFDHEHRIQIGSEVRWVRQKAELKYAADGMAISAVGVTQDITERKQAEIALRSRDERFQLLFNRATDGIIVMQPNGTIVAANESFARMHGYTPQEMQDLNLRTLDTPATLPHLPLRLQRILAGESLTFEVEHFHKDGHVVPLEVSSSLIVSGSERLIQAFHRDISERKRTEETINNLAFYDSLTHLPNRRLLLNRVAQVLTGGSRHQQKSALLFIDLDNFKTLNDSLGHVQGDALLAQVAKRLLSCVREGDTVARLGSDEFVVILEDLSTNEIEAATQSKTVAEKMLVVLGQDYQLDHGAQHSSAGIGITLFGGGPQESSEEPLKRAELAMYQAKAAGRHSIRFFDPQMQVEVTNRALLEAALREALVARQFVLFFQSQVMDGSRVAGVEVLVRWQHPKRGLVSPGEFIPLAEETGLILPLGQWILDMACEQLARWSTQVGMMHLSIAVNVSARQFHQHDFVNQVMATLARTGAKPNRLKLELTESMLLTDVEAVIVKMKTLKGNGVGFSLDDFGTGYSSLSYLKRLPLDQLKIDQGFVRDILINPDDAAICKMVIALADSLGLTVIAEGVETAAQRDFLAALGCHTYQGYLFGHPLPLAQFEALVQHI
jgi:diguanylate cyclase (GGDEF)-like protein/PAS domain S-box-containing protein